MPNTAVTLLGGAALGVGLSLGALTLLPPDDSGVARDNSQNPSNPSTATAANHQQLLQRISVLEEEFAQSLETQLQLAQQLEELQQEINPEQSSREPVAVRNSPTRSNSRAASNRAETARRRSEARAQQLAQAGFDDEMIDLITRREGEYRMEMLERRYERSLNAEEGSTLSARDALRQDLGDDVYDRYLFATGQRNRVTVNEVIATSPGEQAGLKAGDTILSYAGERVFNMGELIRKTREGTPGETVPVQVQDENGNQSLIYIPRGPIGIWGGRGARVDPDL